MASVDSTTINNLLKQVYSTDDVVNLQNMAADTFPKMTKSSKKPNGDGLFGGALSAGNQRGQGSQNELEALREPEHQVPEKWRIQPTVFTNVCRLSGLSMEIAKGNEDSFSDNLTFQMDNGISDSTKELNAQCYRDGSGKIAQCAGAVVASTSVPFDHGVPTHFRVGMYVDIINAGAVKQVDSIKIEDIDLSTDTITLASAVSCDDDSWIYRENVGDNAPTNGKELSGYPRITDDGTDFAEYEGIIRSGAGYVSAWKGLEIDANGANLSDDMLQRAKAQMKIYAGTKPNRARSNTSQKRKYLVLTLPQVQYDQKVNRDTGMTGTLSWNGIQWIEDTDCAFDEVILEDKGLVQRYDVYDLKYDARGGGLVKWDAGYDAYVAYAKYYGNVGTPNPRGAIRIHSLAKPTL